MTFIWQKYSLTVLLQGNINCLPFLIIQSDLDIPVIPSNITVIHYLNDTMLIGQSKQELAITLITLTDLGRYSHSREWEINAWKVHKTTNSVKFLRSWWPEVSWAILCKKKTPTSCIFYYKEEGIVILVIVNYIHHLSSCEITSFV